MSLLPQFEVKESYIVKNKINYKIDYEGEFIYEEYGILFTDYDFARKTQIFNVDQWNGFILIDMPFNYTRFVITQYDKSAEILIGNLTYEEVSYISGIVINSYEYTEYENILSIDNFNVGDQVEIGFYTKQTVSGTTIWTHTGAVDETWFVDGYTDNYTYWSATGLTTTSGETSGTTNWIIDEKNPIFKYRTFVKGKTTRLQVERKIEDYLINDLNKISGTTDVYYDITNLNTCNSTYEDFATAINNSIFGDYLDLTYTYSGNDAIELTITPTKNDNHLYFNFDDITFNVFIGASQTDYKFTTNYLYNKYTLQRCLKQYGYIGSDDINLGYLSNITASNHNGSDTYTFDINNISDADFYRLYTYIELYTTADKWRKCLLVNITGTTFTVITSPQMESGEIADKIQNITDIETISKMLQECYINIEGG